MSSNNGGEAIKLFEKSFDIKLENQTEIGNSHTYVSDNIFYIDDGIPD